MTSPDRSVIDFERVRAIVADARVRGLAVLPEPEARSVLEAMGIEIPVAGFVPVRRELDSADGFVLDHDALAAAVGAPGANRVAVRLVSPAVAHKTEVGGVEVVERDAGAIGDAIDRMRGRLAAAGVDAVDGFLLADAVTYERGLGGELLVSARWTGDAGPVVTVGAGGTEAEAIAADLEPRHRVAVLSPTLTPPGDIASILERVTAVRLATTGLRGRPAHLAMDRLLDVVGRFLAVAEACIPGDLVELEVNPIVVADGRLIALDVLARLGDGVPAPPMAPRPVHKLARLLEPASIALIGVSAEMNLGHVILRNLLRDGFETSRITIVKPGLDELEGVACVPDLAALPGRVDLFVVAVAAAQAAAVVAEIAERDLAETMLVIPGGLEEKQGTEAIVGRMRAALDAARARPDGGPLLNGGNCLGFRSVPGRCDTTFIPGYKLPPPVGPPAPLAIVSQSGGFAITRLGRLADLHPRYLVTVGNQMDVTVGDHVAHLADDPSIAVYGVYLEGFRPLDASRFVTAARRITASGRTVVLYRGGRTASGAASSAGHTASIAGDVVATRALAEQAGVLVADSLDEFDDLVRTATLLAGRTIAGRRLGAISNAGYECVAIGDNVGTLVPVAFPPDTAQRIGDLLASVGAGSLVDVRNPLDATPMTGEATFIALAETILGSPGVDVGVVGVVPLAPTVRTLPPGPGHDEDLGAPDAVAASLVDLWHRTTKAWVAIVDAGSLYDPFAAVLEAAGMPVFRTADRAMRALGRIVTHRLH
jgi:acyl-CoA synthetase (NDP forming)